MPDAPFTNTLIDPLTLRFNDAALEQRFEGEFRRDARDYYWMIAAALLGLMVVLSITGLFVRFSVNADGIQRLLWWAMIPITGIALVALHTRAGSTRPQQVVLAFVVAIAAVSVVFPRLSLEPGLAATYGFSYPTLVLFTMFVFSRFAPRQAALVAAAIGVAYSVAIGSLPEIGASDLRNHLAIMAGASTLGFAIGYLIESSARRAFALRVMIEERERALIASEAQLREANVRSETLLLSILPASIAERLKLDGRSIADGIVECSVLFSDLVGFTVISQQVGPHELVRMLNTLFTGFDELTERHGLEKIKTIGDAYMAAGGVPAYASDHAARVANMALDMIDFVADFERQAGVALQIRIGIHSGPVVAGIVGTRRFTYDLWGDAVNTAARMESHGSPCRIQVTEHTAKLLSRTHRVVERGVIEVKGKGAMRTYWLEGRQDSP